MKNYKFILIFLIFTSIISCDTNDEEMDYSTSLIGEWMRTDFSDDFEFKLIFNDDNTGYKIYREGTIETEITSSLIPFDWKLVEDNLTFNEYEEIITTKYYINSEGELMLENYSDLPFIRMQTD
ncbi:hypothetical protein MHL31_09345 [Lutibacter sp. A80]|uniref:hypothetical protein n=1 Tax=Lutibacter sp. A80 TaxID=2918453 RepID=UPI001F058541|nr:hypothetical protein [Lutibacter sp. A80]UMB59283.1 hypothetical protein MHL31_09345 [Lutibacter sp. A80]